MMKALKSNSICAHGLPALYIITFLSGISIGLFNPFISTLMAQNQVEDIWIGANSTVYFLAIVLVTPTVAKALHKFGLRITITLGLILMGLSAPLFPMTTELSLWFVIRFIMGIACSLYLVSGQTALNYFCNDNNRAIVNGINALALTFGFGVGPIIGSALYQISPQVSFSLGSLIVVSGVLVVWVGLPEKFIVSQPSSHVKIIKKLKLPLIGAFAYGFAESTLVSLYPVYLLKQNYTVDRIGQTLAVFVVGGLIATIPVTYLGDKLGRLKLLLATTCIVLFSFFGLSLSSGIASNIFAFVAGASISPVLPLAMALIGEKLSRDELSAGSAIFTSAYTSGCMAGPIISSVVMQIFGDRYVFSLVIMSFAVFLLHIAFASYIQEPS
jgi:MFS family permease